MCVVLHTVEIRMQFKRINCNEITSQSSANLQMKIAEKSNATLNNWGWSLLNISSSSAAAAAVASPPANGGNGGNSKLSQTQNIQAFRARDKFIIKWSVLEFLEKASCNSCLMISLSAFSFVRYKWNRVGDGMSCCSPRIHLFWICYTIVRHCDIFSLWPYFALTKWIRFSWSRMIVAGRFYHISNRHLLIVFAQRYTYLCK